MSKSARSVKDCLTVPGISLPLSHLAGSAVYRESEQAAIAGQINGSDGEARPIRSQICAVSSLTSALNPADPWPFDRIAPQSDADWRLTAPEAEF